MIVMVIIIITSIIRMSSSSLSRDIKLNHIRPFRKTDGERERERKIERDRERD